MRRVCLRLSDRDVLRRRVRVAAAGATSLPAFFAQLYSDGVLVKERRSQLAPDRVTGYAVALAKASGRLRSALSNGPGSSRTRSWRRSTPPNTSGHTRR